MSDMIPDGVARAIKQEEAVRQQRIKQLTEIFDAIASQRKDDGAVSIPLTDEPQEKPRESRIDQLRSPLPTFSSAALRKIADDCEKLIAGRTDDGVFE